ncbi:hypothetical protein [Kibdelosporangium phytohabitans]|uniref:Uncharacterized protein n=1 Tax=Kibdelosporangium phytohabitans TaxID=860235 RepID=A0A0N9IAA3_9PSEU|nr:hypothetical protein [Kibdelosporangium phytohabitans]ALG12008.1 hypothetical protein AOZ06_38660 [Kibdelosporangium phytohabitans]MBE1463480.1 hypothetical protein [Kibdelosporangium phytohabitans]
MNQFWVDPESLGRTGEGYDYVKERLESLKRITGDLGYRYYASFGDDDEGKEFYQNFQDGHQIFLNGVNGQAKRVGYVGEGLNENGRIYGAARDEAELLTNKFRTASLNGPSGDTTKRNVDGTVPFEKTHLDVAYVAGEKTLFDKASPKEVVARDGGGWAPAKEGTPAQKPDRGRQPLGNAKFVRSQRPLPGSYPLNGIDKENLRSRSPEMISALGMRALRENEQPMFGGRPLQPGQRIVSATELPGGVVRLGVDRYSSITPLEPGDLTLQDPNDPKVTSPYPSDGRERLFLVTERPDAAEKPYDEQVFMEFRSDGKPSYYRYEK